MRKWQGKWAICSVFLGTSTQYELWRGWINVARLGAVRARKHSKILFTFVSHLSSGLRVMAERENKHRFGNEESDGESEEEI